MLANCITGLAAPKLAVCSCSSASGSQICKPPINRWNCEFILDHFGCRKTGGTFNWKQHIKKHWKLISGPDPLQGHGHCADRNAEDHGVPGIISFRHCSRSCFVLPGHVGRPDIWKRSSTSCHCVPRNMLFPRHFWKSREKPSSRFFSVCSGWFGYQPAWVASSIPKWM